MRISSRQAPAARDQAPAAKDQKGSALLTVLWMAAALSAIAISVAANVRSELDHVSTAADGLRAQYLATGSVDRAIQWMLWGGSMRDEEGNPRWKPNTPRLYMTYPSGDAVVEMIPESSKMSVNRASEDELTRLVAVVTGDLTRARQIAAGIVQYRSPVGAAPPAFGVNPTFRPRGASFEEIEELLSVPGVTPELFYGNFVADAQGRLFAQGGLRDALSVWGGQGGFDANTVSPAVMEAIGIPQATAQALIARRQVQPFVNQTELNELGVPPGRLRLGGNLVWTLRASARLRRPDGQPSDVVRTAAAVIKYFVDPQHSNFPVHVLRSYEDAWSQFAVAPPAAGPVERGIVP